jgi:hypothetical protein
MRGQMLLCTVALPLALGSGTDRLTYAQQRNLPKQRGSTTHAIHDLALALRRLSPTAGIFGKGYSIGALGFGQV